MLTTSGIGPLAFGATDPATLISRLTPLIGAPTRNSSEAYPAPDGSLFTDPATEAAFDYPAGQTVCFANELCAFFGAATAADVTFVGYRQQASAGPLATTSGVTIGSIWASYSAAIVISDIACFSTGYGTADGVDAVLVSSGVPFQEFDAATETFVTNVPDEADVTVINLSAGSQPFFLFEDC